MTGAEGDVALPQADAHAMPTDENLSALIGRIYDAALDPGLWPQVLDDIACQFESTCCHMFVADLDADELHFAALNERFSFERAEQYHSYYRRLDDRLALSFKFPIGRALLDWELLPPEDFIKSEFYNDFYVPHQLRWALMGLPGKDGPATVGVCIARPPKAEAFGKENAARLQMLFPHIERAICIMRRMNTLGSMLAAEAEIIDRVPVGVLIVSSDGRALYVNEAARRIIDQHDGLAISRGKLFASLANETRTLRRAIGSAAKDRNDAGVDPGGTISVSRPSLRRAFQVLVVPIKGHRFAFDLGDENDLALVLVSDPELGPMLPEEVVARLYGLTAAEAKLAVQLAHGDSLKEVADATRRSENTLRWTLKNLLAKAGCRRQIDLVRMLHSGPVAYVRDGAKSQ
jgi:DNA-binding CsgD family transcriptional regulator/PAS domain-containing protein